MKKRFFVEILKEICADEGFQFEVFSHDWLCKITHSVTNRVTWTEGYNFNLNTAVNYITLYDKVSTSIVLENNEVPCVTHYLVMKEGWRVAMELNQTWQSEVESILEKTGSSVVVKYATGSQGMNVFRCTSRSEIFNLVNILKDKQSLAISKYYESEFEYRFYILKGEVLLAYKKIKGEDWRHNLSQGAKAVLIDQKFDKYFELELLAKKAFTAFGLSCAAVDILDTKEGLKVIELNNGVMMDSFAATNHEYYKIAKEAHKKMLLATFD